MTQLNVLVIEDDEALRRLLTQIIQRREHQVITADSAEAGLEVLPFWTFHVAFLDHNLPGMEGLLLGEYLRRSNPDMMIAMVTGTDDPRVEARSREHELKFIRKPFEVADIMAVIDDYEALAREREERRQGGDDEDFAPPFNRFGAELAESFGVPKVPGRIEDRILETVKRSLSNLRSAARYTERDRVIALSGLLAARVLGMTLPRASSGRSLFEEYDHVMVQRGRRTEFG
jgi:CheY-like chemotaxis protein